jgi:hypothetical protein
VGQAGHKDSAKYLEMMLLKVDLLGKKIQFRSFGPGGVAPGIGSVPRSQGFNVAKHLNATTGAHDGYIIAGMANAQATSNCNSPIFTTAGAQNAFFKVVDLQLQDLPFHLGEIFYERSGMGNLIYTGWNCGIGTAQKYSGNSPYGTPNNLLYLFNSQEEYVDTALNQVIVSSGSPVVLKVHNTHGVVEDYKFIGRRNDATKPEWYREWNTDYGYKMIASYGEDSVIDGYVIVGKSNGDGTRTSWLTYPTSEFNYDLMITKLRPDFSKEWQRIYKADHAALVGYEIINTVGQYGKRGYAVLGNYQDTTFYGSYWNASQPFILRLAQNGKAYHDTGNVTAIPATLYDDMYALSEDKIHWLQQGDVALGTALTQVLKQTNDGGFAFTGSQWRGAAVTGTWLAGLVKTDTGGNSTCSSPITLYANDYGEFYQDSLFYCGAALYNKTNYTVKNTDNLWHRRGTCCGGMANEDQAPPSEPLGQSREQARLQASAREMPGRYYRWAAPPSVAAHENNNTARKEKGLQAAVYPNPSTGAFTLNIQGANTGVCTAYLYDAHSRKLATLWQGQTLGADHYQQEYSLGLPAGLYYIRITNGVQTNTQKLIIIKE